MRPDLQTILALIKETRQTLGISQQQIAQHLNMSQPNYRNLEAGNTPLKVETMLDILYFLKIPLHQSISPKEETTTNLIASDADSLNILLQHLLTEQVRLNTQIEEQGKILAKILAQLS